MQIFLLLTLGLLFFTSKVIAGNTNGIAGFTRILAGDRLFLHADEEKEIKELVEMVNLDRE